MAFPDTANRLESVFVQRNTTNARYDQINISGSDLIIYHDATGTLNADKISVWANKYGINTSGSTASASYAISASYAPGSPSVSASYSLSASYAPSASFTSTSSYSPNYTLLSGSSGLSVGSGSFNGNVSVSGSLKTIFSTLDDGTGMMTVNSSVVNGNLTVGTNHFKVSGNQVTTISNSLDDGSGNSIINGNLTVNGTAKLTGSIFGSSSYGLNSLSSSYALSASYAPFSQSYQVSSSYSLSASYAPQITQISSSWASSSLNAISSSYALNSTNALSASYAPQIVQISSSWASSSLSSSYSISSSYNSTATDFSIIQFGDPQGANYFTQSIANFSSSMSWIIANKQLYNIKAVVIPGDLVDVYNNIPMWDLFITQSTRIQQAGINLILSQGNHDDTGGTTYFNTYAVPLITSDTAYVESYVNGTTSRGDVYAQNNNGVKIVYIALSYYNVTDPLLQTWAISMSKKYFDYQIIWLIHGYLSGNNQIAVPSTDYYNYGDISWEKVVSQCPNSTQVMCGHIFEYISSTQDTPWGRSVSVGAGNNIVQNLRFDTQASQNNGLQYIRLYEWKPTQNLIQASTYDSQLQTWVNWNGSTFNIPIRSTYDDVLPRSIYTDNTPATVQTNGNYNAVITQMNVINNLTANSITYYSTIACTGSILQYTGLSLTSSVVNTVVMSASFNIGLNIFPISSSGTWNSGYNAVSASTNWYAGTSKYIGVILHGGVQPHIWRTSAAYASNYISYINSNFINGTTDAISTGITPTVSVIYEDGIKSGYFSPAIDATNAVYQITASYAQNVGNIISSSYSLSSSYTSNSNISISSSISNYAPVSRPDLNNGLILFMPLNEGTGSIVKDYSSNQAIGIYSASFGIAPLANNWNTQSVAGGSSVQFNGSSSYSYIQVNNSNTLGSGLNKMTMAGWFNIGTGSLPTSQIYFAKFNGGNDGAMFLGVYSGFANAGIVSSNAVRYNVQSGYPYPVNDNNWHLMSFTHNGTTGIQSLYLDGKLLTSQANFTGSLFNTTAPVIIGNYNNSAGFPFSGSVQNCKIWNRDLSQLENQLLYQEFSNNFTSSFAISASYAGSSLSSSYSLNSNHAISASYAPFSQSYQVSSSYALSASFAPAPITSSYALTSSFVKYAVSSSTLINPSGSIFGTFGNFVVASQGTQIFESGNAIIFETGDGSFNINNSGSLNTATLHYPDGLLTINDQGQAFLGDYAGDRNSTCVLVDDSTSTITITGETTIEPVLKTNFNTLDDGSGNMIVSGSLIVTHTITGSLFGTSSYSNNSVSASYAPFSQSYQVSSSYALTSSYVLNTGTLLTSGSSYNITASWSTSSISSSYSLNSNIAISSSYTTNALSASYAPGSPSVSASYSLSASYAPQITQISSSYSSTSSLASFSPVARPDFNNGLILFMPLNEGSGSLLHDYSLTQSTGSYTSSNPGHGILVNNWSTKSLAGGSSLLFNGLTNYPCVLVNTANAFTTNLNKRTMAIWFNTTQLLTGSQVLLSQFNTSGLGSCYLSLTTSSFVTYFATASSTFNMTTPYPYNIADGNWHLYTATHNGTSGTQSVYLDGKLISTASYFSGPLYSSNTSITLGCLSVLQTTNYSGALQNAKIWNRDLSPLENQLLYSEFQNPFTSSIAITSSYLISTGTATSAGYILTGSYTSTVTGSYTLQNTDNGKLVQINSGSYTKVIVPTALNQGFACSLLQTGVGQIIVSGSGVTVNNRGNHSASYAQWSMISVMQLTSASYLLQGDTA